MYNNSVLFTSLGAPVDRSVQGPFGVNVFRISGGMTHLISSIKPLNEEQPSFSQIFVIDKGGTEEAIYRAKVVGGHWQAAVKHPLLLPRLVQQLMEFLYNYNPYT
jgi:hypothetical protein